MKKLTAILLTMALLLSLLPAGIAEVSAAGTTVSYAVEGGNIYFDTSTGTVTDCGSGVTAANIPSKIGGVPVTAIGDSAFYNCSNLTDITIQDSVTTIGDSAFYNCSNLTGITIPNSVATIGNGAFTHCNSLSGIWVQEGNEVYCSDINGVLFNKDKTQLLQCPGGYRGAYTIPDGVTTIGNRAFYDCRSLTSITIPDSVTTIGDSAFYNNPMFMDVYYSGTAEQWINITIMDGNDDSLLNSRFHFNIYTLAVEGGNIYFDMSTGAVTDCDPGVTVANIPNTIDGMLVTAIGDSAFSYCDALTSITIPDGVTSIGDSAFYSSYALTNITIGDGVTTIGDSAFYYCYALTSITIPDGVTTIGDYAFFGCNSLSGIWVQEGNEVYCSDTNGVLFSKDKTQLLQCPGGYYGAYTIPDSVTTIGDSAFKYCYDLTSITIPDSVTTIGNSAFSYCDALTSITIPDGVTSIGDSAFSYCKALESITIPDSVTTIGNSAFSFCFALTSITIPDGVTTIGDYAFSVCYDLTSITIPDSVTTIGDYAFSACDRLTDVYYSGTEAQWNNITVSSGNAALLNATIHYESPKEIYILSEALGDGDQVVIVAAAKNMALSATYSGFYNTAVEVTPVGGMLLDPTEDLIWTVGVEGDSYTFSYNGQKIGMGDSFSDMPLGGKYNTWQILPAKTEGSYYLFNVGCQVYMEYYETKGNWSGYYNNSAEELFALNFYIQGNPEPPHEHTWDAGKITTAATCAKAGVKTYTCTVCGATKEETIPATDKHVDANADNSCDTCNKQLGGTPNPGTLADGKYVIVAYVDGKYYAMSNEYKEAGSKINGVEITTIVDGTISAADAAGYVVILRTNAEGRTIQGATGYLSYAPVTNINASADPYTWTITEGATEGTWSVIATATTTTSTVRGLLFQAGSYYRFGGYANSNVGRADFSQIMFIPLRPVGDETHNVCTYDTGEVTTEATCEEAGVKTYTCIECGATKTETIPATGHNYEITYSVEADCKWTGAIRYTCSNCGNVKTEILPALGHSFDSGTVTTPASCTEEGVLTYTCGGCGETKTEAIPAMGHSFDQGAVTTPASCTEDGVLTYTCEGCGETKTEPIPATGHLYIRYSNNGPNHSVMCAYCRNIYTETHNFTAGDCICGAAEPAVDGSIQISHTLNLASDIAISYVIVADSLSEYDSYYMECVTPVYEGNTLVGSTTHILEPDLRGSYYYFILDGLTSLEMNDTVEARLYMTKAGKTYTSEPDHYSIATYAYNKLNSSTTAQDLKTVCANLLQYGSKAQLYKEYRTDALPDGEMTAEHRSYLTDPASVEFGNNKSFLGDHSEPTVTFVGAPLRLDSKIIVRYVIDTTAYKGNMEDLSLRVSYEGIDGSIVSETLTDLEVYYEAANYYAFDFDGLLASELRTVMRAVVYEGDTPVSETMTYSVDTYGNGRTGTLLTLIQAMMAYSDSCKAYFA